MIHLSVLLLGKRRQKLFGRHHRLDSKFKKFTKYNLCIFLSALLLTFELTLNAQPKHLPNSFKAGDAFHNSVLISPGWSENASILAPSFLSSLFKQEIQVTIASFESFSDFTFE